MKKDYCDGCSEEIEVGNYYPFLSPVNFGKFRPYSEDGFSPRIKQEFELCFTCVNKAWQAAEDILFPGSQEGAADV